MACSGTCTCGCCAGISQETPQTVLNRPGLPAISYRAGTWSQFRDTLLARISLSRQPLLRELRTREDDDFTIALMDAFAVMADVLTFYTERYENESYLGTATEKFSVAQLAALVGYQPSPGVAASTSLAFSIDPATGAFGPALTGAGNGQVVPAASQTVDIPVGTGVQSVPNSPNELPQNFETVEAISATAAWNAITPRLVQPQQISGDKESDVTTLMVSGQVTNLKPGDPILILPGGSDQNFTTLRTVKAVTPMTDATRTVQTTQIDLDGAQAGVIGYNPKSEQSGSSALMGQISDVPQTVLGPDAVTTILGFQWDQSTLAALAKMKKWPIEQLEAAINTAVSQRAAASGGRAFVLRQQGAAFGFNIPIQEFPNLSPAVKYDPVGNAALNQWTASVGAGAIFMDAPYPQILPGSFILLKTASASRAAQVSSNDTVTHSEFDVTAKVSLIRTDQGDADLKNFTIRATSILCQSEELPLSGVPVPDDVPNNAQNQITLSRAYLGLTAGHEIVLSGQRTDLPGTTASEIRTLDTVLLVNGYTVIKLDEALDHTYSRPTVQINANVAAATHGSTVSEVLGNGDGTQDFQSFTLKQSPLTYVSADTPSGTATTLKVWVDNELWNEVPYFYSHAPDERIYITRQDDQGHTTVTFGDGQTGSRLPSGAANVRAKYRYGIGTAGLVDANQISLLTSRPLGVRAASNPTASGGAADAETLDDSRANATLTIMALDRIVSLEDYQDFARAFAGIQKALAVWLWNGQQRLVLLTVAGVDGAIIDPKTKPGSSLAAAIADSSEPGVQVRLQSYTPKFFRIAGSVTVLPDRIPAVVSAAIEQKLRTQFSFAARDFGQPVNLSEAIAAIQSVDGVQDVELTALYFSSDAAPSLQQYLIAAAPIPGARSISPAELLTLDAAPLFPDLEVTQ
jgi:hypothetical protein